jgi:hypothetical protein
MNRRQGAVGDPVDQHRHRIGGLAAVDLIAGALVSQFASVMRRSSVEVC